MQVLQRDVSFKAWGCEVGRPDGKNDSYLLALDPKTRQEHWKVKRPAKAESLEAFSTPVIHDGEVFVWDAGDDYKLLHQTKMEEGKNLEIRSTIAVASGNLFIRTNKKLFCIGE